MFGQKIFVVAQLIEGFFGKQADLAALVTACVAVTAQAKISNQFGGGNFGFDFAFLFADVNTDDFSSQRIHFSKLRFR